MCEKQTNLTNKQIKTRVTIKLGIRVSGKLSLLITVKVLLSPRGVGGGAYLISGSKRGGLLERSP